MALESPCASRLMIASSWGTIISGNCSTGNHRSSAALSGSAIRGVPCPGLSPKEEVDPLVSHRIARLGSVHCAHSDQVSRGNSRTKFLQRLALSSLNNALPSLDVTCGRGRPVAIHVARVLSQLEQHVIVSEEDHIGSGNHRELVKHPGSVEHLAERSSRDTSPQMGSCPARAASLGAYRRSIYAAMWMWRFGRCFLGFLWVSGWFLLCVRYIEGIERLYPLLGLCG
jgi:hypothetical protein